MKISAFTTAGAAAAALILLAGCGSDSGIRSSTITTTQALTLQPSSSASRENISGAGISQSVAPDETDAAAYCQRTSGSVEYRQAVYGTNGPNPLRLAGRRAFCQYAAHDGSRIHVLLTTLYTEEPTLAALAYILKPAIGKGCTGNPASCYCSQLGGSDQFGGTSAAGGGWYLKPSIDQTLEACIFPDTSSIDSWGLTYHAYGIVRGIDLNKVMRYKYKG